MCASELRLHGSSWKSLFHSRGKEFCKSCAYCARSKVFTNVWIEECKSKLQTTHFERHDLHPLAVCHLGRTHREARSRAWVSLFSAYLEPCASFSITWWPRIPRYSDVDDPTGDLEQRILRRHSLQSLHLLTEAFMMGIFYPCMDPCIFKHIFEWKDLSQFADLTSLTHCSSGRMIQEFGKRLSKLMADWLRVGWPWDACHSATDVDSDVVSLE